MLWKNMAICLDIKDFELIFTEQTVLYKMADEV